MRIGKDGYGEDTRFMESYPLNNTRRDLGLPNHRERGRRSKYLTATMVFSPLLPPHPRGPARARAAGAGGLRDSPLRDAPGCYTLGGTQRDLHKRLTAHLRGHSDNARLREFVSVGAV